MKQTAVEWLIKKLESQYIKTSGAYDVKIIIGINDIAEAKAMEKEQIVRSFIVGNDCGYCFAKTEDTQQYNSGEQYYNETYNK